MNFLTPSSPLSRLPYRAGDVAVRAFVFLSATALLVFSQFSAATMVSPGARAMGGAQKAGITSILLLLAVLVALACVRAWAPKVISRGKELVLLFCLLCFSGMPLAFMAVIFTARAKLGGLEGILLTGNLVGLISWARLSALSFRKL